MVTILIYIIIILSMYYIVETIKKMFNKQPKVIKKDKYIKIMRKFNNKIKQARKEKKFVIYTKSCIKLRNRIEAYIKDKKKR